MSLPDHILQFIGDTLGAPVQGVQAAGGGSYAASIVETANARYFAKYANRPCARVFASEAEGLTAMAQAAACRIPEVIAVQEWTDSGVLLMEWLPLAGSGSPKRLAEALASVHALTNVTFGWQGDGWLGTVPHPNGTYETIAEFFVKARLQPHTQAAAGGLSTAVIEQLENVVAICPEVFADVERPALVHGDLWGGNHGFLDDGTPVLYDPSPAWGCPAYDLGFARSFSSFSDAFFDAYAAVSGNDGVNFRLQQQICELIIMLAHVTMFGGGYAGRVRTLVGAILD